MISRLPLIRLGRFLCCFSNSSLNISLIKVVSLYSFKHVLALLCARLLQEHSKTYVLTVDVRVLKSLLARTRFLKLKTYTTYVKSNFLQKIFTDKSKPLISQHHTYLMCLTVKGTVMQIEKALINVFQKYPENFGHSDEI